MKDDKIFQGIKLCQETPCLKLADKLYNAWREYLLQESWQCHDETKLYKKY